MSEVERILVKGANWLGDAVMSLPVLAALRRLHPAARITVLTKPSLAELYALAPGADETLSQGAGLNPLRAPAAWWRVVQELRVRRFQLAVVLPGSFVAALAAWAGGAGRRIGYAQEGRSFLLTEALPKPPEPAKRHRVEFYLNLLAPLGPVPPPTAPRLEAPSDARAELERRLREVGIAAGATCVALNPGATYGSAKQWLPERFVEVGRALSADGARVLVLGGPEEAALGARVAAEIPGGTNFAGRTSLPLLAAALARTAVLVTNDTGPMHVAQAVGTPVVAIFGPTDPVTTPPFGDRHTIVRRPVECSPCLLRTCPIDHRCMTRIEAGEVLEATRAWLARADEIPNPKAGARPKPKDDE
ncbi:MAG: lipopolysaccharide heptosyltransferase II [Planctomycetes bacterium]|nr:lipopolysaccharide heptosyltransferase II [Planctomycetota bacterium]